MLLSTALHDKVAWTHPNVLQGTPVLCKLWEPLVGLHTLQNHVQNNSESPNVHLDQPWDSVLAFDERKIHTPLMQPEKACIHANPGDESTVANAHRVWSRSRRYQRSPHPLSLRCPKKMRGKPACSATAPGTIKQ